MLERRKTLLRGLRDEDGEVRAAAAEALDRLDLVESLPMLVKGLGELNSGQWVSLLRSLATVRLELCLRIAVHALDNQDPEVRTAALDLIQAQGDWRGTATAVKHLTDAVPVVRARAAEVLGQLGDRRATGPLATLLHDPDPEVVARTATALGLLGHAPSEARLLALAEHPDPEVRAAVLTALGRIPLTPPA